MSWFKDALERRTVWPYKLADDPVKLDIEGTLFAGRKEVRTWKAVNWKMHRKKPVDASLRWDLFSEEVSWDRIVLHCTASIDHPGNFSETAVSFGILAFCKNTRHRSAARARFRADGAEMALQINRSDVSGQTLLQPVIILTDTGHVPKAFPGTIGARLATGFNVSIFTDAPADRPGGGIEILWQKFDPEVHDSLFELTIAPPQILLRLNNEHPSLKTIFEDLSKTGNRARIRNALFSLIASDVWLQLAEFAAQVRESNGQPEDTTSELGRKILKSLSKLIRRPAEEIAQSFDDPEARAALSVRIQHAMKSGFYQNALITGLVADEENSAL